MNDIEQQQTPGNVHVARYAIGGGLLLFSLLLFGVAMFIVKPQLFTPLKPLAANVTAFFSPSRSIRADGVYVITRKPRIVEKETVEQDMAKLENIQLPDDAEILAVGSTYSAPAEYYFTSASMLITTEHSEEDVRDMLAAQQDVFEKEMYVKTVVDYDTVSMNASGEVIVQDIPTAPFLSGKQQTEELWKEFIDARFDEKSNTHYLIISVDTGSYHEDPPHGPALGG